MFRHVSDPQIFGDDDDMPATRDVNMTETRPCHCGVHVLVGRQASAHMTATQTGTCSDGGAHKVLRQQR